MAKSVHERAADNIRILSISMVEKAKTGHAGEAMGRAEYIYIFPGLLKLS